MPGHHKGSFALTLLGVCLGLLICRNIYSFVGRFDGLRDADPRVRIDSIHALLDGGHSRLIPAVSKLVACFGDSDPQVRRWAAFAAHSAGPSAIPAIIDALTAGERDARIAALYACVPLAPEGDTFTAQDHKTLMPHILGAMQDPDKAIRAVAVAVVAGVCVCAETEPQGIEALCESLSDTDMTVRARAACALGWIARDTRNGSALRAAIPWLSKALNDDDKDVRTWADLALRVIENPAAHPVVARVPLPVNPKAVPSSAEISVPVESQP